MKAPKVVPVVVGLLFNDMGLVLMAKRLSTKLRPDMWEYPGGKVEDGETHEAALVREWQEELGVKIGVMYWLDAQVLRAENDFHMTLYRVRLLEGVLQPLDAQELAWMAPSMAIKRAPLVPSCYLFYRAVRNELLRTVAVKAPAGDVVLYKAEAPFGEPRK